MGRRLTAILAASAALVGAGRAAASGGGELAPWYLDQYGGDRDALQRLYDGKLGIVMARAPRPMLFMAWRGLHGLKVGGDAGEALSIPCCDIDFPTPSIASIPGPATPAPAPSEPPPHGVQAWIEARKLVPDPPGVDRFMQTEREGPNYTSTPNCFPDAFDTAATTLKARAAAHGAGSPEVRAWLATQDVVFAACAKAGLSLPPAPADTPAWLRADRAYQEAAFDLYDGRAGAAAGRWAAIARDAASPWRPTALYLRTRALMRIALAARTPAAFADARTAIDALAAAPAGTYGREDVPDLRRVLDFRARPDALAAQLDAALSAPTLPEDAAVAFKDLDSLGGRVARKPEVIDWIDTLLPAVTEAARSARARPGEAYDLAEARLLREANAAALAHARSRWASTRDPAWLLAAISLADPGAPDAAALVADAERVATTHPAWLTLQHHAVRLTLASAPAATSRVRLDRILARTDLTPGDRNVFTAARAQVAASPAEFARLALRRRICVGDDGGCLRQVWLADSYPERGIYDGDSDKGAVGFGEDARAVIDRLPLAARIALSRDATLPAKLRLDVALTSYGRAVQLQDWAAVDALARDLATLLPQLTADWRAIPRAKAGPDKRFAAYLPMAKIPGLRVDLIELQRPEGTVGEFQRYWTDWIILPNTPAPPPAAPPALAQYQQAGFGVAPGDPDARTDLTCLGECGRGAAPLRLPDFAAALQAQAFRERAYLFKTDHAYDKPPPAGPPGSVAVWDEMLAYIAAHPKDPRAPEALYWLVHVGRFGGSHDHSGRRAFKLLHARYPASAWAKKTPYFYD